MDCNLVFFFSIWLITFTAASPLIQQRPSTNDDERLRASIRNEVDDYFIIEVSKKSRHSSGHVTTSDQQTAMSDDNNQSAHTPSQENLLYDDIDMSVPAYFGERSWRFRWPGGIVPVEMNMNEFDQEQIYNLTFAFSAFHEYTCIQFVTRQPYHRDYVRIKRSHENVCNSQLGHITGQQYINLGGGCFSSAIIMHELMHTLGFEHEQCRPDRDAYVTINWDNIKPGMENNFEISSNVKDYSVGYDFESVMHYGPKSFSRNNYFPTIVPKIPISMNRMGQRVGFSPSDILKINNMYQCNQSNAKRAQLYATETEKINNLICTGRSC